MKTLTTIIAVLTLLMGGGLVGQANASGLVDLPETGQTTCYDTDGNIIGCSGTGQDGDIQAGVEWPSPRFTDHGDGTVTDHLTGLMWTKDANLPGGTKMWEEALEYAASLNNGSGTYGYTDWRLPNIKELESIVDAERINPALPQGHPFNNVQNNSWYWSATTNDDMKTAAWILYLLTGQVDNQYKNTSHYVWPVRTGQTGTIRLPKTGQTTSYATGDDGDIQTGITWPSPRFTDHGDGTVTDNLTGLMWTKDTNLPGFQKTWQQALNYMATLNTGGYTDWRLPNRKELLSLIDRSQSVNVLTEGHPFINLSAFHFWSSSTRVYDTKYAWGIYIHNGGMSYGDKTSYYYVWPVRSGQVSPTTSTTPTTSRTTQTWPT